MDHEERLDPLPCRRLRLIWQLVLDTAIDMQRCGVVLLWSDVGSGGNRPRHPTLLVHAHRHMVHLMVLLVLRHTL